MMTGGRRQIEAAVGAAAGDHDENGLGQDQPGGQARGDAEQQDQAEDDGRDGQRDAGEARRRQAPDPGIGDCRVMALHLEDAG